MRAGGTGDRIAACMGLPPAHLSTNWTMADLDNLIEPSIFETVDWQSQEQFQSKLPDLPAHLTEDLPRMPASATLGQNDLFGAIWPEPAEQVYPVTSQPVHSFSRRSLYESNFGGSFELPELNNLEGEVPRPSLVSPSPSPSPASLAPATSTRQLSQPLPAVSPAEESSDVRVTFKDKHNASSERPLSLAERNKQAQRRHRQRQKDRMVLLEAQVKQLSDEKAELQAEKAELAGQNAVLTQVLATRDNQIAQASRTAQEKTYGFEDNAVPIASSPQDNREGSGNDSSSAVDIRLAQNLAHALNVTSPNEQRMNLDAAQVRAMSPQQLKDLWMQYLNAMMKELKVVEAGSNEDVARAEARITHLLREVIMLLMRYAMGDLRKMKQFVASFLDAPQHSPDGDLMRVWRAASRSMGLDDIQKQSLIALRSTYLSKQKRLCDERLLAIAAMHKSIPSPASAHDIALQFLRMEHGMKVIQAVLSRENRLIVELVCNLLLKEVRPMQAARCLMSSFPRYPDSLCILTWIAAEAGDPEALQLLGFQFPLQSPSRSPSQSLSGGKGSYST